jgi:hypothetical protein
MRRREFMGLLGGAALTWPLAAGAQQGPKTIGLLGANSAAQQSQWTAAFVQRLRELGWIEGRNIAIEARWAEGSNERAAEFAAELVRRGLDVIVTSGTPIALAAKRATATVPIVFATASDPVGTELVVSLRRPGGNVTGLSVQSPDLSGKRLELLREMVPGFHRCTAGDPDSFGCEALSRPTGMSSGVQMRFSYAQAHKWPEARFSAVSAVLGCRTLTQRGTPVHFGAGGYGRPPVCLCAVVTRRRVTRSPRPRGRAAAAGFRGRMGGLEIDDQLVLGSLLHRPFCVQALPSIASRALRLLFAPRRPPTEAALFLRALDFSQESPGPHGFVSPAQGLSAKHWHPAMPAV